MADFPQIEIMVPNFLTVQVYKNRLGKFRLSHIFGKKILIVFYLVNLISIASTEFIGLSEKISDFRKLSTQILPISVDSRFCHLNYFYYRIEVKAA